MAGSELSCVLLARVDLIPTPQAGLAGCLIFIRNIDMGLVGSRCGAVRGQPLFPRHQTLSPQMLLFRKRIPNPKPQHSCSVPKAPTQVARQGADVPHSCAQAEARLIRTLHHYYYYYSSSCCCPCPCPCPCPHLCERRLRRLLL